MKTIKNIYIKMFNELNIMRTTSPQQKGKIHIYTDKSHHDKAWGHSFLSNLPKKILQIQKHQIIT